MAYGNKYQYGTSPRKIAPEYRPVRKQVTKTKTTARKPQTNVRKTQPPQNSRKVRMSPAQKAKLKQEKRMKSKVIAIVLFVFTVLFIISYRSSLISQNFAEIKDLKTELETLEKENQQLSVGIEAALNLNNIEKIATKKLGMQKLKSDQIVYLNLDKEDYIQPASEEVEMEENQNFIQKLISKIF